MANFVLGDGTRLVTLTEAGAVEFSFDDVMVIGDFKQSRDKIELQRLKDTTSSLALGSIKTDDIQVEMLSSIAADTVIDELFEANTKQSFAIIKPTGVAGESVKFDALIVDVAKSAPSNDIMKTTFTLGIDTTTIAVYTPA